MNLPSPDDPAGSPLPDDQPAGDGASIPGNLGSADECSVSPYSATQSTGERPAAPTLPWYRRDPLWLLFVVLLVCFCAFVLTSVVVAVTGEVVAKVALVARADSVGEQASGAPAAEENSDTDVAAEAAADRPMPALYRSAWLFCISVIIPQLAMVIPALLAVALMVEPVRRRLGLVRGNWPVWLWLLAALGTLPVGMLSGLLVQWLIQPLLGESRSLNEMTAIFRLLGKDGGLLPLALVIGLTPGIFEELLFRGYLQTGLTRRWGAYGGILVASVLFAVFHLDPVHATGVLLIGVYLGWVYWASGSLIPAMLGHFFNNFFSVMAMVALPQLDAGEVDWEANPAAAVPLLLFSLVVLASLLSLLLTFPTAWCYRHQESLADGCILPSPPNRR